jgi:pyrimidine operon attenuation protein/uracil phosphoribosyltransferase
VLSAADLSRTLDRMAHQLLERHGDHPLVLLGIPTRGVVLARRLGDRLGRFSGRAPALASADGPAVGPSGSSGTSGSGTSGSASGDLWVGSLDITLYRDDLRRRPPRALAETALPPQGIDEAAVVLVDDVLYSGRTVRAALDALRDHGRPALVQLAVLVDRGHRQLPVRADYVGKNIPTAIADDVAVRLTETDGVDQVVVTRTSGGSA